MRRNLYLEIQDKEEAREKFLAAFEDKIEIGWEEIPAAESLGRVTWEAVYARYSCPSYNSCAMDGIAVLSKVTAGASEDRPVFLKKDRDYVEVDTGDLLLEPFDAVIMAEDIVEIEDGCRILAPTHPFAHVRAVGEDMVAGEMVLPSCHTIRPVDVSVLLASGIRSLKVRRIPTAAIIPTGDEMVDWEETPEDGKILETNSYMLRDLVTEWGGKGLRCPIVRDRLSDIKEALRKAAAECDLVIINAGSSAGRDDYTAQAIEELGKIYTHGVAIKPGKPVILGEIGGKPVIGLPGYPVAAYLTFLEFAAPILEKFTGKGRGKERRVTAQLTKTLMSGLKYEEYVRVKLGMVEGRMVAAPLKRGAAASMSLLQADGFCVIPKNREGVAVHETVEVRLVKSLEQIEKTVVVTGSHDLILDVLNDILREQGKDTFLSSTHVGSLAGLMALRHRETHLAPSHLLGEEEGVYNLPVVREMFPGERMVIIKGVGRRQGLMVPRGNPKGIRGIEDLTRPDIRYINRQRGAGTRVLLDHELKKRAMDPGQILGYGHEAATHMAVAVAVEKGTADTGLGVYSSARALGLDFMDVGDEEYDFVTYESYLSLPGIREFLEVLTSREFRLRLEELGGYSCHRLGEILYVNEETAGR